MKKFLIPLIAALMAYGCVYEFDPDIPADEAKGLVVEGDIIIGDVSTFTLKSIEPLSGEQVSSVRGWVWIEDDAGGEYYPESSNSSDSFEIDMTNASPDHKYRLRIRLSTPVSGSNINYSSTWKEVQKAPQIDDLSYTWTDVLEEEITETGALIRKADDDLHLWLSLTSPGGSGCFRWDFEEIWEFHAEYMAKYYFDPVSNRARSYGDQIPPLYNCWSYAGSTQAGLAIVKSTGGEKVVGYNFYNFDRHDLRLQVLYYIKLKARNISEECYEYLHSIEVNSTSTGSLTQPDPSQIIGNITCDEDPMEVVYGYIEVSRISEKSIYIPNTVYIPPQEFIGDEPAPPPVEGTGLLTPMEAYESGLRLNDTPSHWVDRKCVECTALGGTKNKPAFWPTDSE